jgi:hypothetical protein
MLGERRTGGAGGSHHGTAVCGQRSREKPRVEDGNARHGRKSHSVTQGILLLLYIFYYFIYFIVIIIIGCYGGLYIMFCYNMAYDVITRIAYGGCRVAWFTDLFIKRQDGQCMHHWYQGAYICPAVL